MLRYNFSFDGYPHLKTEILTPCRSKTPENIENKIGVNDYVMGHAKLPIFVEIGPTGHAPHTADI